MSNEEATSLGAIKADPRSVKPFKSSEEYLWAMKEDLAEWFNDMYDIGMDAYNFFDKLEDGVILCQHAKNIIARAEEAGVVKIRNIHGKQNNRDDKPMKFRKFNYKPNAQAGTWLARDNISHFIDFCLDLHVIECLRFETDDLVLRKNERSVVLSLLEVARHGFEFGMTAPVLVKMEFEINTEMNERTPSPDSGASCSGRSTPTKFNNENKTDNGQDSPTLTKDMQTLPYKIQRVTNDLRSLHERVVELIAECTCPTQFPIIRIREGLYRIGGSIIYVRILRDHIMVRVGGGWDTLSNYLNRHDPCRCANGHNPTTPGARMDKPSGEYQMVKNVEFKRVMTPIRAPREPWK